MNKCIYFPALLNEKFKNISETGAQHFQQYCIASSEDPDQPAHPHSLIGILAEHCGSH